MEADGGERSETFYATLTEQLLPVRGAGRRARQVATEACLRWDLPLLTIPACIAVSELVANGVVHAGTMLTLTVSRRDGQVCVAVEDGSTHHPHLDTGRDFSGLSLVTAVATAWGYYATDAGKVVWAWLGPVRR